MATDAFLGGVLVGVAVGGLIAALCSASRAARREEWRRASGGLIPGAAIVAALRRRAERERVAIVANDFPGGPLIRGASFPAPEAIRPPVPGATVPLLWPGPPGRLTACLWPPVVSRDPWHAERRAAGRLGDVDAAGRA